MQGQDDDARAPVGRALAAARQERGLSVDEVASAINLRATVVRAIERDDFELCGGDVYARGHLRAYARHVGLDEGPLLAAYAERSAGSARPHAQTSTSGAPADDPRGGPTTRTPVPPLGPRRWGGGDVPLERSRPSWALVGGAALAVVLVLLVVQLVSDLSGPGRGTSEVAAPVATATVAPLPSVSATASPAPSQTPGATASATDGPTSAPTATPDGVAVALRFTGDSWVSVRDFAGRTVFAGLLSKGDARRFSDGHGLRLTLGNAGAVQLTVNGKSIGSAGGRGEVVRLNFGPGDPA